MGFFVNRCPVLCMTERQYAETTLESTCQKQLKKGRKGMDKDLSARVSIAKSARAPTATARARERERERDPTHAPLRFVRSFRFPMWSRVIPMRAAAKSFAGQFRLGNSKSALGQRNFKRMW